MFLWMWQEEYCWLNCVIGWEGIPECILVTEDVSTGQPPGCSPEEKGNAEKCFKMDLCIRERRGLEK